MKPRISRLRHRITLLRPEGMPDWAGGIKPGFVEATTVAGDYQPVSANRVLDAESTEIMHRARVTIRAGAMPEGFDAVKWRLRAQGLEHTILSVMDQDGDRRFVTFIVTRTG